MALVLTALAIAATKTAKKAAQGVRVTEKVIQMATSRPTCACISVHGVEAHQGLVRVTVGETSYTIMKKDSHAAWATHQGAQAEDFCNLFNHLATKPGEFIGEVEAITE